MRCGATRVVRREGGGRCEGEKGRGGGASKMEEGRHERTELTAHHFRGENISSKNIMISSPTKFYVSTCECADGLRNEHTFQGIKNKRPSSGRAALKATRPHTSTTEQVDGQ